jgi:hypothetical protein
MQDLDQAVAVLQATTTARVAEAHVNAPHTVLPLHQYVQQPTAGVVGQRVSGIGVRNVYSDIHTALLGYCDKTSGRRAHSRSRETAGKFDYLTS